MCYYVMVVSTQFSTSFTDAFRTRFDHFWRYSSGIYCGTLKVAGGIKNMGSPNF